MSDESKTTQWDDSSDDRPLDPLGVIGWVIGGKYKVRSYIGGGGFGEVYDGFNVNLVEQKLVVKFFKKVQERDKFDKEAKILCLLDHPNICRVIDYLPEEGALVVAFIDGKDGKGILGDSGPLPSDMLLKVGRTMTSALAYAHGKKIAHRDIKPDNIIIDKNGHVYLIDFGIAKVMREDATKTAYQALTPMFAAPERQGGDANYNPFLSDIYETGVTLFNFATNEMPYRNPANPDIDEWGGPKAKNLSPHMKHVLRKATHPDPSKRYKSIEEMGNDLKGVKQVYGGKSNKSLWIAAALVVLVAGGAFITRDRWLPTVQSAIDSNEVTEMISENKDIIPGGETVQDSTISEGTVVADIDSSTTEKATEPVEEQNIKDDKPDLDKEQAIIVETPKVVTIQEESKPEPEPEPPKPPPLPTLVINVVPDYNVAILVDGVEKSINKKFNTKKGTHDVTIIHPDFPILTDQVETNVDRSLRYNLKDEFYLRDTIKFTIGAIPSELDDALLEVLFNGYGNKYSSENVPVFDLQKLSGKWQVRFNILNAQGRSYPGAKVDSAVTFPFGGGPHEKIKNGRSTIDFGTAKWQNVEPVTILVYWSKS